MTTPRPAALYPLPDVSPGQLRRQLRRLVRLIPGEERRARWEARRCLRLDADRLHFGSVGNQQRAVWECGRCPARVQCALRALEEDARSPYEPYGVFGGLLAQDRARALSEEALRVR